MVITSLIDILYISEFAIDSVHKQPPEKPKDVSCDQPGTSVDKAETLNSGISDKVGMI